MKTSELHEKLQEPFTLERGFGVMKLSQKEWQNIYFIVPPSPPREISADLPYKLLAETLKVMTSLPRRSDMSDLDKLINYLFVRREVVQSSRLEGTWSTIDHALTPGEISDADEGRDEHKAVRSYAKLLEDIIERATKTKEAIFTTDFICEIQKKIVENDPKSKGIPGKLRTEGSPGSIVTIGGGIKRENSTYNPAPASEVPRCLEEVLDWLSNDQIAQRGDAAVGGLSLPVRLAIAHSHFEAVHPFTDGNGRTGRALWPLQMVCAGNMPLYLSGYVEEYKDNYGYTLEEAQKRLNYIPLIEFICNAIIESDLEAKKTKKAIYSLEDKWQARGTFRAKSAPRRALKLLLTNPIISASFLEQQLEVSKTASIDAINSLASKKIIKLRRRESRRKIYAAEELIQILSRPFGSEIELALEKAELLLNG